MRTSVSIIFVCWHCPALSNSATDR